MAGVKARRRGAAVAPAVVGAPAAPPKPFIVPGGVKKEPPDELGKLSRKALLHEVRKWRDLAQSREMKVQKLMETYSDMGKRLERLEYADRDGAKEWVTFACAVDLELARKELAREQAESKRLREALKERTLRVEKLEALQEAWLGGEDRTD